MKRVVLLRHGKSSWSDPALPDHDRPLAERGVRDAKRMAKFVADSDLRVDLVLCSSARRARQTWAELAKRVEPRFGVRTTRELYMPAREQLLACLRQVPERAQTVMVVGHNPSLEAFALSVGRAGKASLRERVMEKFPTGALCVVELGAAVEAWASLDGARGFQGRLSSFVAPKGLAQGWRKKARAPSKATTIELEHKPRWRSTAATVFEATTRQLRENALGARQGSDSEYVHQMRVAVRRLRTALNLFRGVLAEPASEHLGTELRWLFGVLGPPREYDVVLEQVLSPLDSATGLDALCASLVKQRRELLEDLAASLASQRFERLVSELLEQQARLSQRDEPKSPKLKPRARERLSKRLRKVRRLEGAVDTWLQSGASSGLHEGDALHTLRKELKKLRYACEFVQAAYPRRRARRYLRKLGALQDVLGELQDSSVSARLLARHLKRIPERDVRAKLRAHVQAPLDEATIRALGVLPEVWLDFKKTEPFWL